MSSVTRRQLLTSGAIVGLATGLPATVQAKIETTSSGRCPYCSADLAMGDLHWPGCVAGQDAVPSDSEIKPETIKTAQAQRRSSDKKSEPHGSNPCDQYGCDRCKIQKAKKGGYCYHKNTHGCAVQFQC